MADDQLIQTSPPRGRFDAVVESNTFVCREHHRLRLRLAADRPFPATRPGQFIQLGCRPPAQGLDAPSDMLGREIVWQEGDARPVLAQPELCGSLATLRKPFSLSGRGDDGQGTWIEIIHRVVGKGTAWLAPLTPGTPVDLIGPLGNAFALPTGKSRALLVGGGVGLPPMFYLAQALHAAGWDAVGFVGALTRDLLAVTLDPAAPPDVSGRPSLGVREFAAYGYRSVVTTDDGSLGLRGRITLGVEQVLADLSPAQRDETVVFTCGPEPMMHAVADLAARFSVDCQVCMEQAMACGMGTCQSCIVRIEDSVSPQAATPAGRPWRYKLACTDGPVFAAPAVVW